MEKLADLPTPALVTLGFVLALIIGIRYVGLWQGASASPTSSAATAQVAAVIVDPTALNRATDQVGKLVIAVEQLTDQIDRAREDMRFDSLARRKDN